MGAPEMRLPWRGHALGHHDLVRRVRVHEIGHGAVGAGVDRRRAAGILEEATVVAGGVHQGVGDGVDDPPGELGAGRVVHEHPGSAVVRPGQRRELPAHTVDGEGRMVSSNLARKPRADGGNYL